MFSTLEVRSPLRERTLHSSPPRSVRPRGLSQLRLRWLLALVATLFLVSASPAAALSTNGKSAIATGNGEEFVFKNVGGQVAVRAFQNSAWQPWVNLGGSIQDAPVAVSWRKGHVDVYARFTNNWIMHRYYIDGVWSPQWDRVGDWLATSQPSVISWGDGRTDVFARGTDNALIHAFYDGGQWYPWESLSGGLGMASGPSEVSWQPGHLDVFARGSDNKLYHRWFTNGWSNWEQLGSWILGGAPTAATWGSGNITVFARGTDNSLIQTYYNEGSWHGWESMGGTLRSDPDAVSRGYGDMEVMGRGTDDGVWHRYFNGSAWQTWASLGGGTTTSPQSVTWGAGHTDVFLIGTDGQEYHRYYVNGGWSGWEGLGTGVGAPAPSAWPTSTQFGGADNHINTAAEADAAVAAIKAGTATYAGVHPDDRPIVDPRGLSITDPVTTLGALQTPTPADTAELGDQSDVAIPASYDTRGCREGTARMRLKGTAGVVDYGYIDHHFRFCWNKRTKRTGFGGAQYNYVQLGVSTPGIALHLKLTAGAGMSSYSPDSNVRSSVTITKLGTLQMCFPIKVPFLENLECQDFPVRRVVVGHYDGTASNTTPKL